MISPQSQMKPVGYYCDHSDEPNDARTHHDWEFVEDEGFVFQPRPETTSAFTYADRPYLKPEDNETRCARAVPLYMGPTVAAELERQAATARVEAIADVGDWLDENGQKDAAHLVYTVDIPAARNMRVVRQGGAA
ncbi:hypothetical protein [Streptomyces bullii]|uniref:Uncharacterized protein n=1 Tax=Streptomyces bullii TaxID=349910 RepID=A0ABW0UM78_9ACTN